MAVNKSIRTLVPSDSWATLLTFYDLQILTSYQLYGNGARNSVAAFFVQDIQLPHFSCKMTPLPSRRVICNWRWWISTTHWRWFGFRLRSGEDRFGVCRIQDDPDSEYALGADEFRRSSREKLCVIFSLGLRIDNQHSTGQCVIYADVLEIKIQH